MVKNKSVFTSLLALAVLMAACAPAATPTPEPTTSLTVDTPNGPVTVPPNPQRIVTLHAYTLNALLDVGVVPVGTAEVDGATLLPEYVDVATAIPSVGDGVEFNLETIASLKPDLIVGGQVPGIDFPYEQLSAIAPTVLFEMTVPADWKRVQLQTAELVGKTAEAEANKKAYDNKTASIKQTYADTLASTKWALVTGWGAGEWGGTTDVSWAGVVMADAGFQFGKVSTTVDGAVNVYSYEGIPELADATVILVEGSPANDQPTALTQELINEPLWQTLPAAQQGHVYALQHFYPLHYKQALAVLNQLEEILKGL